MRPADSTRHTFPDDIHVTQALPGGVLGKLLKPFAMLIDRIVGMKKLREIYQRLGLSGLDKDTFCQRLIVGLGVCVEGKEDVLANVPEQGSLIIVCNHPYGMIEGVIMANLIASKRKDTKVLANVGLQVFRELSDYFIFANPLKPQASINHSALKKCFAHLDHQGVLVLFPAGRVSFFQKDKQVIADGEWNRLAVNLAKKTDTPILPVHISGTNSELFHSLGRIYYRFRLMMLAREMFKLGGKAIQLSSGKPIKQESLNHFITTEDKNIALRSLCYLQDIDYKEKWREDNVVKLERRIMPAVAADLMQEEIAKLPQEQHLVDFKNFSVYCGYKKQLPHCVAEITRLREVTFRQLNEGSGESCDTDGYDESYLQLFIFDHKENEIIGAYRIGLTDQLQKNGDKSALYLSQMFNFHDGFINQKEPCMEMGRSFIVEKHQNSFYGLLLLWKGIGAFAARNPQYRTLYGTVSLSKLYDPRSVALMDIVMTETSNKGAAKTVEAKMPFVPRLNADVEDYLSENPLNIDQLSVLVTQLESDGKDVPVLLKQYHKLGAKFHTVGIDENFNHTPGMLLSVHLPSAPSKMLKLYLGKEREAYLNASSNEHTI